MEMGWLTVIITTILFRNTLNLIEFPKNKNNRFWLAMRVLAKHRSFVHSPHWQIKVRIYLCCCCCFCFDIEFCFVFSELLEFAMNSAVDTSELLGGFEQVKYEKTDRFNYVKRYYFSMKVDATRHRRRAFDAVDSLVSICARATLAHLNHHRDDVDHQQHDDEAHRSIDLVRRWRRCELNSSTRKKK